jgi:hypothetical protein
MTAHHTSRPRAGLLAELPAAASGEITTSATRRGRSPSFGLARGLVDAGPAMQINGGPWTDAHLGQDAWRPEGHVDRRPACTNCACAAAPNR